LAAPTISHYRILTKLGAGGMGEVYLAEDTKLRRKVALKLLSADLVKNEDRLHRFVQEAFAASALSHPNILVIYEIGAEGDTHFIATEYVDGETLRQRMATAEITVHEVLEIAIQVASALETAHAAGIVHRDIKPENVMLRPRGYVKVLDFGLAKLIEPHSVSADTEAPTIAKVNTDPGTILGTVNYMSPEQVRGRTVDSRSDLFSFGVVLYEMATGHAPFAGDTASEVIASILKVEPPPLARYSRDIPEALEWIVTKALTKDREDRYQTAREMLNDLQRLKQRLDVEAEIERSMSGDTFIGSSSVRKATATVKAPDTGSGEQQEARTMSSAEYIVSEIRRHKKGATIMLAGFVIAVSAAIFVLKRPAPALTDKDTIPAVGFCEHDGDAVFDGTLKQALAVQLGQSPFLSIFGDDRVREALRFMGRSPDERVTREIGREICQRQALKALLTSSISALGSHYVMTLEAINAQSGDTIAHEQAEAENKEQVLKKLGDAATSLREKLGESLASIQKFDAPIEQATTSSLEALKAWTMGREQAKLSRDLESIPFYKRALELDPNFAYAYLGLDVAYFNTDQDDLAAQVAEKAFELRDRVSERERLVITATYYFDVTGELDKTIEAYELWKHTYPRDPAPCNDLSVIYREYTGQYEKALEESQESIRRGGDRANNYGNLARAFQRLNRLEESKATIKQGMAQKFDSPGYHSILYAVGFLEGNEEAMQQQIDWARGKPGEAQMIVEQALTAAYSGQLRKARELYERATQLNRDRAENAAQTMLDKLRTEVALGDCGHVKKGISEALSVARVRTTLPVAAISLAQCGEAALAQNLIDEVTKKYPKDTRLNGVFAASSSRVNRNKPQQRSQAIQLLQEATQYELGRIASLSPAYVRGLAYLRQQTGTQAMAEFQKIIDHRSIVLNSALYPLADVGLARAAVLAGDTAKARKAYQDFLALWKDADPDVPVLIEARKEYDKLK
jgi:serine/threonine protein kinase/tetratricopeptide (TPR) repeat protein